MMLIILIAVPLAGGILAGILGRRNAGAARWISLAALLLDLILALVWLLPVATRPLAPTAGPWLVELRLPWISTLGISFHLAADGLSVVLILLTLLLGLAAVACSWSEIHERTGFFFFNLMWVLAGILGVFTALDLFLFYFFWELMMVPMFFLIILWGHENRVYAAIKFFLFTQIAGLLMLAAIIGLYFIHGQISGNYSFDYSALLGTPLAAGTGMFLMLGFFAAFAVKLPAFPVHVWLPDAHTEAPTAGRVVLAGLLLKTGAYGLLRFVVPLFPEAARAFAPWAMALAVAGIIYGAVLAFSQTDLKRLVAYTSVSHMGFVMLAVFAWNEMALQGALIQIICHGLSTGALFVIVGMLQERMHTRDLRRMGGLWKEVPRLGGFAMFFALASLGLPGLGNFVGEFLILIGVFPQAPLLTVVAAGGLVAASIYSLWIVQQAFHGQARETWRISDLNGREAVTLGVLAAALLWLGLYPQPVIQMARPALAHMRQIQVPHSFPAPESTASLPAAPADPQGEMHAIR